MENFEFDTIIQMFPKSCARELRKFPKKMMTAKARYCKIPCKTNEALNVQVYFQTGHLGVNHYDRKIMSLQDVTVPRVS